MSAQASSSLSASETEWLETFRLFDRSKTGSMTVGESVTVMRALNFKPTLDELASFQEEFAYKSGKISENDFIVILRRLQSEDALSQQIFEWLTLMDLDGNGYLTAADLQLKLTTIGENPFSETEWSSLLESVPVTPEGEIEIKKIVKALLYRGKLNPKP